jgi:3-mercaptopyruvate sulfurtransferase SseA
MTFVVPHDALVQVRAISDGSEPGQIVDARPADRFNGVAPEPWQYTQSTTDIEVSTCAKSLTARTNLLHDSDRTSVSMHLAARANADGTQL